MCYPELDSLYEEFKIELGIFRRDITDLVCLNRDMHDRYKCIYDRDNNGLLVLVYLSSHSKQALKIVINYGVDTDIVVTSIFSEDLNIHAALQTNTSYNNILKILSTIKTHIAEEQVIIKLKYGI